MNEELDPLETELEALQPRSPSPRLESAIGNALARQSAVGSALSGVPRRRIGLAIAIAAGAIAASVLAAAWLWRGNQNIVKSIPNSPSPTSQIVAALDPALPSVWSFRGAAAAPADRLDAFLDKHAGHRPESWPEFVQIRGFGVSETKSLEMLREL